MIKGLSLFQKENVTFISSNYVTQSGRCGRNITSTIFSGGGGGSHGCGGGGLFFSLFLQKGNALIDNKILK